FRSVWRWWRRQNPWAFGQVADRAHSRPPDKRQSRTGGAGERLWQHLDRSDRGGWPLAAPWSRLTYQLSTGNIAGEKERPPRPLGGCRPGRPTCSNRGLAIFYQPDPMPASDRPPGFARPLFGCRPSLRAVSHEIDECTRPSIMCRVGHFAAHLGYTISW